MGFLYLGISGMLNELSLRKDGVVTQATVTDTRPTQDRYSKVGYDIQYQFSAGSGAIRYSFSDEIGRLNLWYSPTKQEWDAIAYTNRISVLYLPNNPWTNRPLNEDRVLDIIVGICCGIIGGTLCALFAIQYMKSYPDKL